MGLGGPVFYRNGSLIYLFFEIDIHQTPPWGKGPSFLWLNLLGQSDEVQYSPCMERHRVR